MTQARERLIELLELRRSTLFDIDSDQRLLVGNDDSGSVQLYEISPAGDWTQLTDLGEPCSGRYLPGERAVVVSADTGGTERAQLSLLRLDAAADQGATGQAATDDDATGPAATGQAAPARLADLQPVVSNPDFIHNLLDVQPGRLIYATNRRNGVDFDVVSHTLATGEEQVLWDAGGWFSEARVSPDGQWVVLSRLTTVPASSELLLADSATGQVSPITDPAVPGDWSNVRWLPDSTGLLASSDAEAEFVSLRSFDLASRRWSTLAEADGDVFGWPAPGGHRLAVVTTRDGADELAVHDWAGGPLDTASQAGQPVHFPHPSVLTFNSEPVWAPDSSMLGMTFGSPVQPPEVYAWRDGESAERRTTSNPAAATEGLVQPISARAPAPDGEQIPVLAIVPAEPAGSAVLIIHGGPEAATVRNWSPVAAALALAGHTVVLPNVRGSTGYGRRWLSMDDVEKRLDSVADLVAVRDWLPTLGVDTGRVALYGGSYGGYMVLAGLTFYPELWAAGVDIVGISSLVTFLQNTSAYRRAYREREYGRLAEDRAVLEAASPLPIIDRVRAPLLVIHGANDPRVPLSEAEQVVAAVRGNGIECELLVYPDEGHGLAKRANQLDAYPKALDFLARQLG
ncbi:S9 family peptidase [Jatrophihabitans sp.]|jgi:dipeptidyl aminopeptidase/acylaminoacyl peptidase|uniref:S9 family peptidase n=1 Tax=Jatrophihabitans sp. TaxID=1932789 RepID=UPI002EF2C527